jgi:hypothetical protein
MSMSNMGLKMVVVALKGSLGCVVIGLPHAESLGVGNHSERDRGCGRRTKFHAHGGLREMRESWR